MDTTSLVGFLFPIVLMVAGLACIVVFVRYCWASVRPPPALTRGVFGIGAIGALLMAIGYGTPLTIRYGDIEVRLQNAIEKAAEAEQRAATAESVATVARQSAEESVQLASAAREQEAELRVAVTRLETELDQTRASYGRLTETLGAMEFVRVPGRTDQFTVQMGEDGVRALRALPRQPERQQLRPQIEGIEPRRQ